MTVKELYDRLDALYPTSLSCEWDHDGLMIMKDGDRPVKKALFALDGSEGAVQYAINNGFDLIITHHPFFFHPISALTDHAPNVARGLRLYENNISLFSFHTRLDCGTNGVNDTLAKLFSLSDVTAFEVDGKPIGRIGTLPSPLCGKELAEKAGAILGAKAVRYTLPNKKISRLALLGGGGGSSMKEALAAGADGYITGDAGYHHLLDAEEHGLCLIAAGHDYTEIPVLKSLEKTVKVLIPEVESEIYEKISLCTL